MSIPIRVLVLEDSATDAELVIRELRRAGYDPQWTRVETEAEFLAGLDPAPELILADYSLPHFDGVSAVKLLRARGLDTPFILISGATVEETVVEAFKAGANDYVQKDRLTRLDAVLRRALNDRRLADERRQVDHDLHTNVELLQRVLDSTHDCFKLLDLEGRLLWLNPQGLAHMAMESFEPYRNATWLDFWKGEHHAAACAAVAAGKANQTGSFTGCCPATKGTPKWWEVVITPILDAAGQPEKLLVVSRDITARRQAEEVLAQRAEELERFHRLSVGRELRMIELKQEVNELARLAGRPQPYETVAK